MISLAVAFWIIDRFGRRPLWLTGLALQGLAYVKVAISIGLLATAPYQLFGFVGTQFTPVGIKNIGYRFYIIFAVYNLVFILIVYFLHAEAANRTLEDLDAYFDWDLGHPTIIPIGDKVTKSSKRPLEAIDVEATGLLLLQQTQDSSCYA
ncbi:hypothetical protein F5Y16DRAFT_404320 [Xylariaceae sp. FL0255]|nr:hypothetical protein F5Y16DRAFT_404320 [Xylariaceae sp. FL0255]